MSSESILIPCRQCGAQNRIPKERQGERARCGKCHAPLPSVSPFPDHAEEVSDGSFQREVLDFFGPVLLEFHAPWCGYCKMLSPVLDQLAGEYAGRVKIAKMNVDENPQTASRYGIRSTPALFFFKNGNIRDQVLGAVPKAEIQRRLNSIL
ncbi:MAG: thiol reductase thioredoxin [Deltaproteobacteria bacterium]|nr:thiol reductase thioredoxin [Deltaproteobacteria bacterium]MBP1718567.1 thiol reductase thioredoxin [Deltaproteobacteria bacterium]